MEGDGIFWTKWSIVGRRAAKRRAESLGKSRADDAGIRSGREEISDKIFVSM